MQRWGLTQSASRCSTRDRRPHRSSFTRNVKVGQPRRGNSPIPTSLWFCDVRVGILTFDRWITAPISLDLYEGRVGHASPFLAWPGMFSPPQLCHPDRNRSSSQSDDLWSGGPCVLTSPGCEEQWGSSRNRRKRRPRPRCPLCAPDGIVSAMSMLQQLRCAGTQHRSPIITFSFPPFPPLAQGERNNRL